MQNIKLERTINTPEVCIQPSLITISGRSIPEDSFEFYIPVIEYITHYFKTPPAHTEIRFFYEYINSSSKKFLSNILRLLESTHKNGVKMEIIWQFEEDDESIHELGLDLSSLVSIPFKIEEVL